MRVGNCWAAALAVAAVGMFMPGCQPIKKNEATLFGVICAARLEGEANCVPAEEGPESAWTSARMDGDPPIEMWVEPPAEVSLDQLIMISQHLNRWYLTIDAVLEYVRETQDAESYKATLGGRQRVWLKKVKEREQEILSQKPTDAAGNFKAALTEKASAEKDPLVAKIASDKQVMGAVEDGLCEYKG